MNGWFDPAKISCSASARLILFRLIISFFESTFIANSLSVFFSRTRYTLPTSPFPSSLTLWKLLGPTSALRFLIELDEYVRRNGARGDPPDDAPVDGFGDGGESVDDDGPPRCGDADGDFGIEGDDRERDGDVWREDCVRGFDERAEPSDDFVASEDDDSSRPPCSGSWPTWITPVGSGGTSSSCGEGRGDGANSVPPKRALVLGADATRRRKRVADDVGAARAAVGEACRSVVEPARWGLRFSVRRLVCDGDLTGTGRAPGKDPGPVLASDAPCARPK